MKFNLEKYGECHQSDDSFLSGCNSASYSFLPPGEEYDAESCVSISYFRSIGVLYWAEETYRGIGLGAGVAESLSGRKCN